VKRKRKQKKQKGKKGRRDSLGGKIRQKVCLKCCAKRGEEQRRELPKTDRKKGWNTSARLRTFDPKEGGRAESNSKIKKEKYFHEKQCHKGKRIPGGRGGGGG